MPNDIKKLRRLMFAANHIRKNNPVVLRGSSATQSQALKYAWWFEAFRNKLATGVYRFSYFKTDGSIREARGTLDLSRMPENKRPGTSSRQTGGVASAEKGKTQRLLPKNRVEARVFKFVLVVGKKVLPRRQIIADLGMRQQSRHTFINNYWRPAWERGLIDLAYPAVPHKPEQAYRLTAKGLELYAQLTGEEDIIA